MASEAPLIDDPTTGFSARVAQAMRGDGWMPLIEVATIAASLTVGVATWLALSDGDGAAQMLSPPLVAFLLVANLIPAIGILVLIGRRVAQRRAARTIGGAGRLHTRLVALFSALASVPTLLVVVFASLLFQYGVEFWFSDRARGMLENASILARQAYQNQIDQVRNEGETSAGALTEFLQQISIDDPRFPNLLLREVVYRNLTEGAILSVKPDGVRTLAVVTPFDTRLESDIARAVKTLKPGQQSVMIDRGNRIIGLMPLPAIADGYLYIAREVDPSNRPQLARADSVLADYRALLDRSRSLQLQFNAALLALSLLIVGAAVWIALALADRLVRPVGELVGAARRVADGDLSARVPETRTDDEIGTLATAFNRMTGRLEEQTGALVAANAQLDSRRALIEAVMSGVSAGIISVDGAGTVRLINTSARELLRVGEGEATGQPLATLAPELAKAIADGEREAIVQVTAGGEALTLAARIARDESGHILTFDDITQQLLDQRRAAWSDVARRIAHEIKNPLTPIQLAAERLKRRYGGKIDADDTTFAKLTDTIVRQVGDLRRMVDEFSSFARMPKPVFREESLLDIVRQSVFLHEVANPAIGFTMVGADEPYPMVCDPRQLGQALTNIVKNGIEAIAARPEGAPAGAMTVRLARDAGKLRVDIADNGVGLPADRERLVEPYMTTRARGTGLGLAIVKKIVEEHGGTIAFDDNPGGGSIVTLCFDPAALAGLAAGEFPPNAERTP